MEVADSELYEVEEYPLCANLRVGQVVDVEIQSVPKERFMTRFVGCKEGQYLILEQPDSRKYIHAKRLLGENHALVLRAIFEKTTGQAAAFTCALQGTLNHPGKLFFASFPDVFESKQLRREVRQATSFPAKIARSMHSDDGDKISGTITDISEGGCCFECEVADHIKGIKQTQIFVELNEPEKDSSRTVMATVRSQRKEGTHIYLGLSFDDDQPNVAA